VLGQSAESRRLDEIENHALILPLGEGISSVKKSGPHRITFGWAIAPRLNLDPKSDLQSNVTYSLSAVVSLPSWWSSVRAEYLTCWIDAGSVDPKRVARQATEKIEEGDCSGNSNSAKNDRSGRTSDLIRLPFTATEISRKLGFELLDVPHLASQQTLSTLRVGYPGELLLAGERLWRSTDVFLNSQRADRIMVLPNMKGIVAHFNCVLPSDVGPKGQDLRGVAQVAIVTSEGRANLSEPVVLEIPPKTPIPRLIDRCTSVAEYGWAKTLDAEERALGKNGVPMAQGNQ
jgi:hypothetical protein